MKNFFKEKFIFLDFDGVVKESSNLKSDAYYDLFKDFGKSVSEMVKKHHDQNTGISRYEKIPLYLSWASNNFNKDDVKDFIQKFSDIVKNKVINSSWVPGVLKFIKNNYRNKKLFIITATPQEEIEEIINELLIHEYFLKIIGAPTKKEDAIRFLIKIYKIRKDNAVMIGDSYEDYLAAELNKINFIFRSHKFNSCLINYSPKNIIADFKRFI